MTIPFHQFIICRGEEEEEQPKNTVRRTEKRSIDEVFSTSTSTTRNRTLKSPIVTQLPPPVPTGNPENSNKRRTTRRTTIRLVQDNSNGKNFVNLIIYHCLLLVQPQSIENPLKLVIKLDIRLV